MVQNRCQLGWESSGLRCQVFLTGLFIMDKEKKQTHTFVVRVSDETDSSTATMTFVLVHVNENPLFGNDSFSPPERSAIGLEVAKVSASDPDRAPSQQNLFFVINNVTGVAPEADCIAAGEVFAVDYNTGMVKVRKAVLNFEVKKQYVLCLRVFDEPNGLVAQGASLSVDAAINISITDINDAPLFPRMKTEML